MTITPHPYRVRIQATQLRKAPMLAESLFQRRLDAFMRRMLLRAYRRHGNKRRAARALEISYRAFRYHWARLM